MKKRGEQQEKSSEKVEKVREIHENDLDLEWSYLGCIDEFLKILSYSGSFRRDLPRKCILVKSTAKVDVEKLRSKFEISENFSFATKI